MRIIIILSLLIVGLFSTNVSAQTFRKAVTATSQTTAGTVTIAGKDFTGGTSRSGSIWILRVSKKSGKEYKSYLGHKTKHQLDGETVWSDLKGNYWLFEINPTTGYPKKVKLEVEE